VTAAELPAVGTDWTTRMTGLRERHPGLSYLTPRQSPSGEHEAVWTGAEDTVVRMHHAVLMWLVLAVEAALEPGRS
jgi:hypothetical protein